MSPEITAYFGYLNDVKRRLDTLRPSKGRGNRFTTIAKRIIIEATLRGRELNLSDTEVANRLGVSKTAVNRLAGKRETYATPRVNEDPNSEITNKAQLCIDVARKLHLGFGESEVEEAAIKLMALSEQRLQEILNTPTPKPKIWFPTDVAHLFGISSSTSTNGVIKLTTREGYTIEGLSLEQVVELIKVQ